MVRFLPFLCCLTLLAQTPADRAIDAVRARQQQLEKALVDADMAKLDEILTSDFIRTPPGGRDTDKAAYSAIIRSGQLKYISFEDREPKFRAYGDTVLVNVAEPSPYPFRHGTRKRIESQASLGMGTQRRPMAARRG